MNKFFYSLFLSGVISVSGFGQKIVPSPEDLYSDAREFIYSGDYTDALMILLTLEDRGYHSADISYKIGECYLNIHGIKTKAIPYLKSASENISKHYSGETLKEEYAPEKTWLYLGIAYRLNYDFANAEASFNKYLQTLDDSDIVNIRLTGYHIEKCSNAKELIASPALYTTDTLSGMINTSFSSFNPLVTADEKEIYFMKQLKFYDAVMMARNTGSGWMEPDNLTPAVKSDGDHYITGISKSGTDLWLDFYNPYRSGEIYSSSFANGEWSAMEKLNDTINTVFNETHASVSPDGKALYFTSDRKGGFGGLDIYRAERNSNGEWDNPVNLGPNVNSPYNEETPFLSSDGSCLFFSSQGHYNMGGYDVYCSSKGQDGNWLPPVNIGFPLNTPDDDLFWFPIDTGNIGYASRYSSGSPVASIVRYSVKSFGKPARYHVNGNVEISAGEGFDPASVSVAFIQQSDNDTVASRHLEKDGSFSQKIPAGSYKVDFSIPSELLLSKKLSIPDYFPQSSLVLNEKINIASAPVVPDTLYLSDILFGFNAGSPASHDLSQLGSLIEMMKKHPEMLITLKGYTDAVGSRSYNLELSLKRANSIREYMASQVSPQRITAEGYGEDNPVLPNNMPDGKDNPDGRRYNRRVEIVLMNIPDRLIVTKIADITGDLKQ